MAPTSASSVLPSRRTNFSWMNGTARPSSISRRMRSATTRRESGWTKSSTERPSTSSAES
jgi:hypothetical protein